jgi:hypothetical protein
MGQHEEEGRGVVSGRRAGGAKRCGLRDSSGVAGSGSPLGGIIRRLQGGSGVGASVQRQWMGGMWVVWVVWNAVVWASRRKWAV